MLVSLSDQLQKLDPFVEGSVTCVFSNPATSVPSLIHSTHFLHHLVSHKCLKAQAGVIWEVCGL